MSPRRAEVERTTRETRVEVRLDLDGKGTSEVSTGIGFLDHLLATLVRHAKFDLALTCRGDLHVDDLVVKRTASKEVREYRVDSPIALASRQLADRGIAVHAGEKIAYVITGATAPDKGARVRALPLVDPTLAYDPWKYLELLLKATEAVLTPCGVDFARLAQHLDAAGLDVSAHLLTGRRRKLTG